MQSPGFERFKYFPRRCGFVGLVAEIVRCSILHNGPHELKQPRMSSARIIDVTRFMTEPSTCSYLRNETACLEYRVPWELNSESYGELLRRGWRRFGNYVFRPQCRACSKCRPLRVDVNRFRPSKSQRRTLKRNQHVDISFGPPGVSDERIELFNRYHSDMTERRGWSEHQTSSPEYADGFLGSSFEFAGEFLYRDAGRLVGVSLVDISNCGLSSMYFYHDPDWRPLGPGTFSVLTEKPHGDRDSRICTSATGFTRTSRWNTKPDSVHTN